MSPAGLTSVAPPPVDLLDVAFDPPHAARIARPARSTTPLSAVFSGAVIEDVYDGPWVCSASVAAWLEDPELVAAAVMPAAPSTTPSAAAPVTVALRTRGIPMIAPSRSPGSVQESTCVP